ncbi:nad dependent epimerase dehydratase [Stemphylium lycopersici]|nr:nad dependent epimerase dehydratase [Stemphylium lycopersici]
MAHNILLIGGHGKVAQLLTPLLLAKSWNVTSMIRTASQQPTIEKLGQGQPGKLSVLVSSVADVKSENDAKGILDQVKPDWVVWSAGAAGKGGAEMTFAVDRDAAIAFTKASINTPSVKKFLTVSYLSSRRGRAPWWNDEDWASAQKVNNEILPDYFKAKVAADEVLTVLSNDRVAREEKEGVAANERFCGISLRPGTLTEQPAGNVNMGKIGADDKVSRATVAEVTAKVLEKEGVRGWVDFVDGQEEIATALDKYVKEGQDAVEGEDLGAMRERIKDF